MRFVSLALILCSITGVASSFGQQVEDKEAVLATFEVLRSAVNSGDAGGFMANATDDAMLLAMTPGGPPPVGRPALAEAIEGLLGGFTVVWDGIQTEEVVVVGDLAFHRYTGVLSTTPKEGGDTNRADRRYLDILRRDAGGEWKLWQHIFAPRASSE